MLMRYVLQIIVQFTSQHRPAGILNFLRIFVYIYICSAETFGT